MPKKKLAKETKIDKEKTGNSLSQNLASFSWTHYSLVYMGEELALIDHKTLKERGVRWMAGGEIHGRMRRGCKVGKRG